MKLIDLKTIDFINQVDSNSPAPGGGSVSALISSLGVSLARMVGHLTIPKKKYEKLDKEIKADFENHLSHLNIIKDELVLLIDKDTEAFNDIMSAYKISKETPEKRNKAIEEATLKAIEVPYRVSIISLKALELLPFILTYGNKQTISDLGVATLALASGIEGALLNVLVNLPGISDEEIKSFYMKEYKHIINKTYLIKDSMLKDIYKELLI
ncbi:cyclodeaminase/cyclohydrolase family protein [Mariniplasma anaerobium]|uniref:Formiminotetrahydrofolate cyclodeaminase n=1 Tax=Mariniplasma anaerobium TaxID=2735436 RepID=A0A7U9TI20_9MOLU|nr:cyclodeaminase/cyclohydrolase family protein [Mariniplasma anaerobium]BCR35263.1 formiminotetrahydrofolate cyclodeaminase [Mariniplasma anaerobium]